MKKKLLLFIGFLLLVILSFAQIPKRKQIPYPYRQLAFASVGDTVITIKDTAYYSAVQKDSGTIAVAHIGQATHQRIYIWRNAMWELLYTPTDSLSSKTRRQ